MARHGCKGSTTNDIDNIINNIDNGWSSGNTLDDIVGIINYCDKYNNTVDCNTKYNQTGDYNNKIDYNRYQQGTDQLIDKQNNINIPEEQRVNYADQNGYVQKINYYGPVNPRYDPGVSYFTSIITPIMDLTPEYSGCTGCVEFKMRRKNKTVTLQWEPFSGSLAVSGIANLSVVQTIYNLPPYPISIPIYIRYKDLNRLTNITIDPHSKNGNIKFFLNNDLSGRDTNMGDSIYVYGAAISWIVD